jgi:hypothetical protein
MSTMTEDQTYNGWKNYPTWAINLWLSNDEGIYNETREIVERTMRLYDGGPYFTEKGVPRAQVHPSRPTFSATHSTKSIGAKSRTPGWKRTSPAGCAPLGALPGVLPHFTPHRKDRRKAMRYYAVRALWACADTLDIVRDGLIVLASKVVPR